MRPLQTTLFVLLLIVLATQSFRHVYVKWIEPTDSVLDKFRERVEEDIASSTSLEELTERYAKAKAALKGHERTTPLEDMRHGRQADRMPLDEEQELRMAIERVEAQDRELFKLRFYWGCGLLSVLLGLLAYARLNAWIGMVGMITGFLEMAVWTSPLWRSWGPRTRFDRFDLLLDTKLTLSLVSTALLIALWLWRERCERSAARLPV